MSRGEFDRSASVYVSSFGCCVTSTWLLLSPHGWCRVVVVYNLHLFVVVLPCFSIHHISFDVLVRVFFFFFFVFYLLRHLTFVYILRINMTILAKKGNPSQCSYTIRIQQWQWKCEQLANGNISLYSWYKDNANSALRILAQKVT